MACKVIKLDKVYWCQLPTVLMELEMSFGALKFEHNQRRTLTFDTRMTRDVWTPVQVFYMRTQEILFVQKSKNKLLSIFITHKIQRHELFTSIIVVYSEVGTHLIESCVQQPEHLFSLTHDGEYFAFDGNVGCSWRTLMISSRTSHLLPSKASDKPEK